MPFLKKGQSSAAARALEETRKAQEAERNAQEAERRELEAARVAKQLAEREAALKSGARGGV